jgi:hypothetical protein
MGKRDFVALVGQAFPEDAVVDVAMLQTHGILSAGLSRLNAPLISNGRRLGSVWESQQG